jgi:hypothetical protein
MTALQHVTQEHYCRTKFISGLLMSIRLKSPTKSMIRGSRNGNSCGMALRWNRGALVRRDCVVMVATSYLLVENKCSGGKAGRLCRHRAQDISRDPLFCGSEAEEKDLRIRPLVCRREDRFSSRPRSEKLRLGSQMGTMASGLHRDQTRPLVSQNARMDDLHA